MKRLTESDIICKKLQGKDMLAIIRKYDLSLLFIENNKDKFSKKEWNDIIIHQKLSANCIREFQDKLDWMFISNWQKLSEKFIREFQDKVDWMAVAENQKLSLKFRKEFQDNLFPWDEA